MSAAYKTRVTQIRNANQGVNLIDDFTAPVSNGGSSINSIYFQGGSGGSGAVTVARPITPIYFPGAVGLYVQANGDYANMLAPPNFSLSGNKVLDIQTRFYRDVVIADGNENAFGFTDSAIVRANETTGAMMYYNPTVSNNWVCYVRNTASGLTQVTTTIAANVAVADTYLRILVTPNQSQFFVNGVLAATIAKVPDTGTSVSIGWSRHKTSGSSSSSVFVDAVSILQNFTTPRTFIALS